MQRDSFIATIGYDGGTAVVSREELLALRKKSFEEILASKNYRLAAACAIYDDNESEKQRLVDAYNAACGGHYTTSSLTKLFGISEPKPRKIITL